MARFAYWRDITAILLFKAAALSLLYFCFFAQADRPTVSQHLVAQHLLATAAEPDIGGSP